MPRLTLQSGPLKAELDPAVGASLSDLSLAGPGGYHFPLLRRTPAHEQQPGSFASFLMAPWTNRIAGSMFTFRGARYALRPSAQDGTAIHGDVRARAWSILDRSPVSARLRFESRNVPDPNFPFPFEATVRYELSDNSLLTELTVANLGDEPMPAGCGFHPYFMRHLWDTRDDASLRCRCAGRYPSVHQIAVGPAAPDEVTALLAAGNAMLGTLDLDDAFGGWDGRAEIRWPASGVTATFECSPNLGHLVIYTPSAGPGRGPLPWFAVEPVTMVNDGFNLLANGQADTGVVILGPGESLSARFAMQIQLER